MKKKILKKVDFFYFRSYERSELPVHDSRIMEERIEFSSKQKIFHRFMGLKPFVSPVKADGRNTREFSLVALRNIAEG